MSCSMYIRVLCSLHDSFIITWPYTSASLSTDKGICYKQRARLRLWFHSWNLVSN